MMETEEGIDVPDVPEEMMFQEESQSNPEGELKDVYTEMEENNYDFENEDKGATLVKSYCGNTTTCIPFVSNIFYPANISKPDDNIINSKGSGGNTPWLKQTIFLGIEEMGGRNKKRKLDVLDYEEIDPKRLRLS